MSGNRYAEELSIETVRQMTDRGNSVPEVAKRPGVTTKSLYGRWMVLRSAILRFSCAMLLPSMRSQTDVDHNTYQVFCAGCQLAVHSGPKGRWQNTVFVTGLLMSHFSPCPLLHADV